MSGKVKFWNKIGDDKLGQLLRVRMGEVLEAFEKVNKPLTDDVIA